MTDPTQSSLLERSADELATAAQQLASVAVELNAMSKALDGQSPDTLRKQAERVQVESMRVVHAALAARSVGERLAVVAQVTEAANG